MMSVFAQVNASILSILVMHGLPPCLLQCARKEIMSPATVNLAVYVLIISFHCNYDCTCV